jgi:enterochelin esterase-like enzyme
MVWYNPWSWSSSSTTEPEAVSTLPTPTTTPQPVGARRRTRHGRKGSKRYHSRRHRTGKKSNRS